MHTPHTFPQKVLVGSWGGIFFFFNVLRQTERKLQAKNLCFREWRESKREAGEPLLPEPLEAGPHLLTVL